MCGAAHLHAARPPRRQDVIHDEGHIRVGLYVAILLALAHRAPADLDHVEFRVVTEADWRYLRLALRVDGRQAAQALARQELNLLRGKHTHTQSPFNNYDSLQK